MNIRKIIAIFAGIAVFIGIESMIAIGVGNIWPDFSFSEDPLARLFSLFLSFILASMAYNLINGEEVSDDTKTIHKN